MTNHAPSVTEQQDYWDKRWEKNSAPNAWQQRRGDAVFEWVAGLGLSRPRILDLGCATGWFTERLSHIGTATGVDLSEWAIEAAKARYPGIDYRAGNFYQMSFPAGFFDVVVNQEVIAHVPDQAAFLERIARILKPGGYLAITTANKLVMDRVDWGPDPDAHIKRWLSMGEFKRLLGPHFRVLRTTSVIPLGGRGILRAANSKKLHGALGLLFSERVIERMKERAGLGYSLIVLAQRR
jgi:SAM-dependent methyltransferase